jgi:cytosine/adenosine deaminase-related metal-dependent hydrolase
MFDDLERITGKYGLIAAGAPRVTSYDGVLANRLRADLLALVAELKAENSKPDAFQSTRAEWNLSTLAATIQLMYGVENGSDTTSKHKLENVQEIITKTYEQLKQQQVDATRIERARLRLGHLRYLTSQIEDLSLNDVPPAKPGLRRIILSVELTAFVRPKHAGGAIVYFDLYPEGGDRWAHTVGETIEERLNAIQSFIDSVKIDKGSREWHRIRRRVADEIFAKRSGLSTWDTLQNDLRNRSFRRDAKLPELVLPEEILDPYSIAHRYLQSNELVPRVIHVEPLDEGELILDVHGKQLARSYSGDVAVGRGPVGGDFGVSGSTTRTEGRRSAGVNTLSLAFAAGDNRAGWIFLPSEASIQQGAMKPVERRIRMVIDVPESLAEMSVHVHKLFLDKDLEPIEETSFGKQIIFQNQARALLSKVEKGFPKVAYPGDPEKADWDDFRSRTNWALIKSRMRNTLFQTWSEALRVDIPEFNPVDAWVASVENEARPIAIHARVVDEYGARPGWVVFHRGIITGVHCDEKQIPPNAREIRYGGFLYPGLIDVHNHPHYAAIKAWDPQGKYKNRYEWKDDVEEIVENHRKNLQDADILYQSLKYGEIRAVIGGTTSIQGSISPRECQILIRNIGKHYGAAAWTPNISTIPDTLEHGEKPMLLGKTRRLFLHIAEGRHADRKSREEFDVLKDKNLLRPETVIIHGTALSANQLDLVAQAGASIVWSPSSNMRLYGETLHVDSALALGINVALAPDWTITGSNNLLEELKFADSYSRKHLDGRITPRDLFHMVTGAAARAAGLNGQLGRIQRRFAADMFLAPAMGDDPYENLLRIQPKDIVIVFVDGNPVYGDADRMLSAGVDKTAIDILQVQGREKAIVVRGDPRYVPKSDESYSTIIESLESKLNHNDIDNMAELIESHADVEQR